MRAVTRLFAAGLVVLLAGAALLAWSVVEFVGHPLAASSTSGVRVFRLPDGSLGGFDAYAVGLEPVVIGAGLALMVAAALIGAVQPSSRSLASTSGRNAAAQTR